jgi:hypothetical protein
MIQYICAITALMRSVRLLPAVRRNNEQASGMRTDDRSWWCWNGLYEGMRSRAGVPRLLWDSSA